MVHAEAEFCLNVVVIMNQCVGMYVCRRKESLKGGEIRKEREQVKSDMSENNMKNEKKMDIARFFK